MRSNNNNPIGNYPYYDPNNPYGFYNPSMPN